MCNREMEFKPPTIDVEKKTKIHKLKGNFERNDIRIPLKVYDGVNETEPTGIKLNKIPKGFIPANDIISGVFLPQSIYEERSRLRLQKIKMLIEGDISIYEFWKINKKIDDGDFDDQFI